MTATPNDPLESILRSLKVSPIFHLSLASKELFHSNFLAWLCENYPSSAGRLFGSFLKQSPPNCDNLKVDREWKNTDIRLVYPGGETLIIENKVKSLPDLPQLQHYSTLTQNREHNSYLLLSLTRPTFLPINETTIRLPDGAEWHYISYGELASKLQVILAQITAINSYHGQLLHDYINFAFQLDALQAYFIVEWNEAHGNFFGCQREIERLRTIRLHDVVYKMRFAQLSQQVKHVLENDGFLADKQEFDNGREGQVLVTYGMTNGVGLFDFKYCLMGKGRFGTPVLIGVQIQGVDFRLMIEVNDRTRAPKIAEALHTPQSSKKVWFNFERLPNGALEYPRHRVFNQYAGQFFYRSKRLENISPQHLVQIVVAYAREIRCHAQVMRNQIDVVL